jgi:signal transduction histidine kinase
MTYQLLPSSLRGRLLAAFLAVIFLTLILVGSAVVWIVQSYRTQLAVDHFSELAVVASGAGRELERQDAKPEEIAAFVSGTVGRSDVRVLVTDTQGKVVAEGPTPSSPDIVFVGRQLDVAAPDVRPTPIIAGRSFLSARTRVWAFGGFGPGRRFILLTPVIPPFSSGEVQRQEGLERFFARQATYRIVLAVPVQSLGSAWRELFPRLLPAALTGVLASAAAAWWLARSISSRLRRITIAAEQMSRGALRQTIPIDGTDEVAQLATAFNTMSQEVERSHRALKDFLANASHELRTPLTSIQGFSQALVDGALYDKEGAQEAGRIINEESERMRRLVEDLLYLSRVESADVPASRAPVDVAALLREESRRVEYLASQRDLHLDLQIADLPTIDGDADELDRLFGNLLENAGKYTPEGGTITVRTRMEGNTAVVMVSNTGSYIPPEDLPHIFERFYRVEKSRARDVEGSGLGLAIAREVVQRHGGTIDVTSDPAMGTAFTVRLPRTGLAARRMRPEKAAAGAASRHQRAPDSAGAPSAGTPGTAGSAAPAAV